jgi:SSS family solute:Na+ symporter
MMGLISGQIYQYLQSVQSYVAPPIASVFLLGLTWKRLNAYGAITTLISGFVLSAVRLVAELNKESLGDGLLYWYADVNFLHFGGVLFLLCSAILVLVSLLTPEPPAEQIAGLTRQTLQQRPGHAEAEDIPDGREVIPETESDPRWRRRDFQLSCLLAAGVVLTWVFFSG